MGRFFGKTKVEAAALTEVGRVREHNEDAVGDPALLEYLIGETGKLASRGRLYAVADGMGGHAGGEVASQLAVQTLFLTYYNLEGGPPDDLKLAFRAANAAVYNAGLDQFGARAETENTPALAGQEGHLPGEVVYPPPNSRHMGTTLVAALILDRHLYWGHVGDSRLYLLRKGKLSQLTWDHSLVAEEVGRGTLTEEQARHVPFKNLITRAVGYQPQVKADFSELALNEGDVLLLCSDGLHGVVDDFFIARALEKLEPQEAARYLVDKANTDGGPDNISVVIVKFGGKS